MVKRAKNIIVFVVVVFVLLFIGFYVWNYVHKKTTVEKTEVLIAQDCGMDGLQCCSAEPKCSFGQECCVDPNNSSKNQCADKCGCGNNDEFCCTNNACAPGNACVNSKCLTCGGENQPCCKDSCLGTDKKGNQLACQAGKCVGCGGVGKPCCGDKCFGLDLPEKTLAECTNGICHKCGGNQQVACLTGERCVNNYLYSNNNCFKCGEVNEPCCADKKCSNKTNKCLQGFCQ